MKLRMFVCYNERNDISHSLNTKYLPSWKKQKSSLENRKIIHNICSINHEYLLAEFKFQFIFKMVSLVVKAYIFCSGSLPMMFLPPYSHMGVHFHSKHEGFHRADNTMIFTRDPHTLGFGELSLLRDRHGQE